MSDSRIHVTLLRHGRSRADDERVHEGHYDSPLTEVGRSQAHARAQAFAARGLRFDRIVASTLQRAQRPPPSSARRSARPSRPIRTGRR